METIQTNSSEWAPWNDAGAEPYIRIENITKKFGDFTAIDDISMDIYETELFCLLGGSGCGKSTLLRMLSGFELPTSGRILIDGTDVAGIPPYKRPVNMMFQSYALFPHMTVEKNVAYGLQQDGVRKDEQLDRVAEMLEMVKLSEFAKRKPHQLSGGQRQRVALARALIKRPKLLLLDEPLGALDKKLRENTQFELMKIQQELGITFIVVTHDQEEAMTLASRIAVMDKGTIAQTATPDEIYEFPNSRLVADFIGSINLFTGNVVEDEPDHVRIRSEETGGVFYISHGITCTPGARVWVGIRPEKIKISRDDPGSKENALAGEISEIAYMGNLSVYQVALESGRMVRVTMPNLERHTEWFNIGVKVFLTWRPDSGVVLMS